MFALFNKDKKFIGYSPDISNNTTISEFYKKLPEQFSNLMEWHWEGDFDTGGMVSNKKAIEFTQSQKALAKILETYSLGTQMINIIKQINLLSKNANLFDNDYKEMSADILEIWSQYNK